MENHSYNQIIGNPNAPYINSLAATYGLATNYYAVATDSLPNRLALIAGRTFGCRSVDCGGAYRGTTIVEELESAGLSWAGYFEDLPYRGYAGGSTGGYVQHHNPFVYFSALVTAHSLQTSVRPLSDFIASLRDPPSFNIIEGTNQHNMHDGTIGEGDIWLSTLVRPILGSADFQHGGVVFITWDEGRNGDRSGCCLPSVDGGHVPTIVIAAGGKRAFRTSTPYTHYSLLRTIEEGFGLRPLAETADPAVNSMAEFWP